MPCGARWQEVNNINQALGALSKAGFGPGSGPYEEVYKSRGVALITARRSSAREIIPTAVPRQSAMVAHVEMLGTMNRLGLVYAHASPGWTIEELSQATLRVILDDEIGWVVEARFSPGAPPIYHNVTEDEAMAITKGEPAGELIARMFKEEEYVGE